LFFENPTRSDPMTRRDLLRAAIVMPFAASALRAEEPGFPGLIVRAHEPRNLEFPISNLHDAIVRNEHFFVRSHFAVPAIEVKYWKLKISASTSRLNRLTRN
jgi:hypothetical protein